MSSSYAVYYRIEFRFTTFHFTTISPYDAQICTFIIDKYVYLQLKLSDNHVFSIW